jgi:hypothetical protein
VPAMLGAAMSLWRTDSSPLVNAPGPTREAGEGPHPYTKLRRKCQ